MARYPYLADVPPDAPDGLDTALPPAPEISWEGRGNLIPIDPPSDDQAVGPPHATVTKLEVADGEEGPLRTWHDVALSIAAELMNKIRAEVRLQLGYTTSAVSLRRASFFRIQSMDSVRVSQGIARNKFLAKVRRTSDTSILASVVYASWRAAHRFVQEAGLTGCEVLIITCITKLMRPSFPEHPP